MDYVEGQDLQEILDRQGSPLSEPQALAWIEQVCDALEYLHSQNPPIIHRDIKPANIKITPEGRAMLVDFGIAKTFDPVLKTKKGAQAVTPGFSPHEQYGQGRTDARTDIYALGATLYTLMTGQPPVESISRMIGDTLTPAERVNTQLSPKTADVIRRAMKTDPLQRYQDIHMLKSALRTQPKPGFEFPKWAPWVGGGVVLLILILVLSNLPEVEPKPTPEEAVVVSTSTSAPPEEAVEDPVDPAPTHTPVPELTEPLAPTLPPTDTPLPQPTDTQRPSLTPTHTLTATPRLPSVEVWPHCSEYPSMGETVTVREHQPIVLTWWWSATTAEYVQDHLAASRFEIRLDGRLIDNYTRSDVVYYDTGSIFTYRVTWQAAPEYLPPGRYKAERTWYWDYEIYDGGDYYGPGTANGSSEYDYCWIEVD
jgi:serine/threonine protein kinase